MAEDIADLTPYNYGLNNPVLMIDPDGKEAEDGSVSEDSQPKPKPKPIVLREVVITAQRTTHWYDPITTYFRGFYTLPKKPLVTPAQQAEASRAFENYSNLLMLMGEPGEMPVDIHPSTPVGRRGAEMKNLPSSNKPTTINGVKFTGHALDQMQVRGVTSPTAVIDVIQNGVKSPGNSPGEVIHMNSDGSLKVVTDPTGKRIITVIPKSPILLF